MCKSIEEMVEKAKLAATIETTRLNTIKNVSSMMDNLHLTLEQALDADLRKVVSEALSK